MAVTASVLTLRNRERPHKDPLTIFDIQAEIRGAYLPCERNVFCCLIHPGNYFTLSSVRNEIPGSQYL